MFRTLRFYHSFFKFLSTPSSRRATGAARHHATVPTYFYPRPPRGGRHNIQFSTLISALFLSTPSARRATTITVSSKLIRIFLSTPSARRATVVQRTGSVQTVNFYPRPPRGGRHGLQHLTGNHARFLSTPSARRATHGRNKKHKKLYKFLSTPSARRATYEIDEKGARTLFLSTPSARRATLYRLLLLLHANAFLSTPSARRATALVRRRGRSVVISIHALREEGDL